MIEQDEILAGIHAVTEALIAKRRHIIEIYYGGGKIVSPRITKTLEMAYEQGIAILEVPVSQLEKIAQTSLHQMIAARVSTYPFFSNNTVDLLDIAARQNTSPFILFLDGIQDVHNLGAILRTALCMGVDGVVIPKDRAATATPAVSRISAGALEHIRLVEVTNLAREINAVKEKGVWITGLLISGTMEIANGNYTVPTGIVMGSEEKGIRSLVQRQCDFLCNIPQIKELNSMNVSVATAMILYEVMRQRRYVIY